MQLKKMTSDEIKRCELNLLKVFAEFCRENNLAYYLVSGTLLGAVRHKGFIPWDDDIDVGMPRKDYNRLKEILDGQNGKINEHVELKTPWSKDYQYCFCKLIDTTTLAKEPTMKEKYSTSVWIDIFAIDKVPDDMEEVKKFYKKMMFMRKYLFYSIEKKYVGGTLLKKILGHFWLPPVTFFYEKAKVRIKMDRFAQKYAGIESSHVAFMLDGVLEKSVFSSDILEQAEYKFEDAVFTSFKDYHTYLTSLYKDYMQLPPEDKRMRHDFDAWQIIQDENSAGQEEEK